MGRQVAGEGFLAGYVRATAGTLECHAASREHADAFAHDVARFGGGERATRWIPFGDIEALRESVLVFPGPVLAPLAWRRAQAGAGAYSITGVTHTIASMVAMDGIADLLTAPLEPWDALVCTSSAALDAVNRLLAGFESHLRQRFGARDIPQPQRALIPLGADCAALAPSAAFRARRRQDLGIADADVVFLFVGRLSFHAKANPYPMYAALEQVAGRTGRRIHLIQAGWFSNEHIEGLFRRGAAQLAPSVNTVFLDGRDAAIRREIWSAADVFISLVDNVQETFGLAPVEAMAAGLPCVVTDWDGYKDTVRHGSDGFRVPTLAPPPGAGTDIAQRFDDGLHTYDRYVGAASLLVAVDIAAAAEACHALAADAALRARMGAAARERALATFDWPVIVGRYRELWDELDARRRADGAARTPGANLRRPDPFTLFSNYPTLVLRPDDALHPAPGRDAAAVAKLLGVELLAFVPEVLPEAEVLRNVFATIAARPGITADALGRTLGLQPAATARAVCWLAKAGAVLVPGPGARDEGRGTRGVRG
jgi:glycosyltransferase involved in cell wall biosynthesis